MNHVTEHYIVFSIVPLYCMAIIISPVTYFVGFDYVSMCFKQSNFKLFNYC